MRDGGPGRLPDNPWHEHAWVVGTPVVGEGTWIGAFTMIDGSGGLRIGAGCDISTGAQIYTHSSAKRCVSGRRFDLVERAPVVIGDRVFVGAGAIVAGVPARVVGHVEFDVDGIPTFVSR